METMTGDGQTSGYHLAGAGLVDKGEDLFAVEVIGGFRVAGRGG